MHFHAVMFNLPLPDVRFKLRSGSGFPIFESRFINKMWPFGFVDVGSVTDQSASYVARYAIKGVGDEYPHYFRSSRRPAIGAGAAALADYKNDCFYLSGRHSIPRIYDRLKEKEGVDLCAIKDAREARSRLVQKTAVVLGVDPFEKDSARKKSLARLNGFALF